MQTINAEFFAVVVRLSLARSQTSERLNVADFFLFQGFITTDRGEHSDDVRQLFGGQTTFGNYAMQTITDIAHYAPITTCASDSAHVCAFTTRERMNNTSTTTA